MEDGEFIPEFERKGIEEVRMLIYRNGYNHIVEGAARRWLVLKDQKAAEEKDIQAEAAARKHQEEIDEQRRWNRNTATAAWLAVVMSVLSLLASLRH